MTSDLIALRDIISSSVDTVVRICESEGKPFPSLHEPIHPSEFTPKGIRNHPQVLDAIGLIVAAATQLVATVSPPPVTLTTSVFRVSGSSVLLVLALRNICLPNSSPCLQLSVLLRGRMLQRSYDRQDLR